MRTSAGRSEKCATILVALILGTCLTQAATLNDHLQRLDWSGYSAVFAAEIKWQELAPSLQLGRGHICVERDTVAIPLTMLSIDPARYPVRVVRGYATVSSLIHQYHALAGINASFFTPDAKPLGLLVIDGEQIQPPRKNLSGCFLIRAGRPDIVATENLELQGVRYAIQSFPLLLKRGAIPLSAKGLQAGVSLPINRLDSRSAAGLLPDGTLLLLTTGSSHLSLSQLATLMGGLGCQDALALDGGASSQLVWNISSQKEGFVYANNFTAIRVPTAILIGRQ